LFFLSGYLKANRPSKLTSAFLISCHVRTDARAHPHAHALAARLVAPLALAHLAAAAEVAVQV
jgi:hypothetical protein